MPNKLSQFWQELKRRRVIHLITVYCSAAFEIIELINNLVDPLNLPARLTTIVVVVLIAGFPLAIILSWLYDLTSEGVEKTKPISELHEEDTSIVPNAWKIATYVSFVVIFGLVLFNIFGGGKEMRSDNIQSLVILPFDNFTGDEDLEYFVSGMHASLIGDMGKIGGWRVISRTSSNTLKNIDMTIPDIGTELEVDAVIETAVMCLGDTICVQFKLVRTSPGEEQLWTGEYREEKSQILNLYNRITRQIANEVNIELSSNEERLLTDSRTVDKEAYDAFLRGYAFWGDLSEESLTKSLEYLNFAIEKDPGWAPLFAGLAQVWALRMQMKLTEPSIAIPKIHHNINKALELDPDFADSHFVNGIIAVWTEWNWEKGEKEFLKALAINPNDVMSRIYYAHLLMILQRSDEAVAQGKLAVDLDPVNPLILALFSGIMEDAREYQAAYSYAEKAIAIDPTNQFAQKRMRFDAFNIGDYEKAFEADKKFYLPFDEEVISSIDKVFRELGRLAANKEIVAQFEIIAQNSYVSPTVMALRYLQANQQDKAMDFIEKGFEIHEPSMPYIGTRGRFESLWKNPRFIDVLEKMSLPPPKNK
jgi:TolB-like protein